MRDPAEMCANVRETAKNKLSCTNEMQNEPALQTCIELVRSTFLVHSLFKKIMVLSREFSGA